MVQYIVYVTDKALDILNLCAQQCVSKSVEAGCSSVRTDDPAFAPYIKCEGYGIRVLCRDFCAGRIQKQIYSYLKANPRLFIV